MPREMASYRLSTNQNNSDHKGLGGIVFLYKINFFGLEDSLHSITITASLNCKQSSTDLHTTLLMNTGDITTHAL